MAIAVQWPAIPDVTRYLVTLTYPDGTEVTIARAPEQLNEDGGAYLFEGLDPGTTYTIELKTVNADDVVTIVDTVMVTTFGKLNCSRLMHKTKYPDQSWPS